MPIFRHESTTHFQEGEVSKQVMVLAGLVGLAILSGCAAKPVEYYECRGNNCNREHSRELSALDWQSVAAETRAA